MAFIATETNGILAKLPEEQREAINRYGEDVPLSIGATLIDAAQTIDHVYFVRSGSASLLVVVARDLIADAGFINREGAVGTVYDIESPTCFARIIVSAKGRALRVPRHNYEAFKEASPQLRTSIDRWNSHLAARSQQTAACNLVHRLDQRLCRWLLQIAQDSVGCEVVVTQDYLSQVLGVTRSRLNETLKWLQAIKGISQTRRGVFRITDIERISSMACACHQAMQSTLVGVNVP